MNRRKPQRDSRHLSQERGQPRRVRPVYDQGMAEVFRHGLPAVANTGLLYDRYADIWADPQGSPPWKPETPRRGKSTRLLFLEDIRGHTDGVSAYVRTLLDAVHARREALWSHLDAKRLEIGLVAPLVSGLGMSHTLETGFVWDRNLGIPFLPGSGLKGLARAWAIQWGAIAEDDALRIFGDLQNQGAGSVTFFSAYPETLLPLRIDVMNPHFGDYYHDGKIPGDWLSPKPVFFLTVPSGTRFVTAVHARTGLRGNDRDVAARLLADAMANLGAAAKTAAGYGYFQCE